MKLELRERNELIANYMPLAYSVASKAKYPRSVEREEIQSAAYLGLVEAASRYDTDHDGFVSYAVMRISGAIKDYLRGLGFGSKGSVSKGCQSFASIDVIVGDGDCLLEAKSGDLRLAFDEITESLPAQGKNVLWQYFVEGKKLKEIGKDLGLAESRISQLISSYKKKLAA